MDIEGECFGIVSMRGRGISRVELMLPSTKVGFDIGMGGETMKSLQESTGAKISFVQVD